MATKRPSTPRQRDFILNLSVDLGLSTRTALFGFISTTLDRTVSSWDEVSLADASTVIDRMLSQRESECCSHHDEYEDTYYDPIG